MNAATANPSRLPGRALRSALWCAVALSGVWGVHAHAQNQKMRPGLWEHSVTMKSQSGQTEAAMAQMQQAMANMSPAQRRQMEQMMAQKGVSMGSNSQSVKVCITPEQAELDRTPSRDGCTQSVRRTGLNTVATSISCKGGPHEPASQGEGTLTFSNPMAYTGQFKLTTTVQGKPEQIDMAQTGKWLASDCGNILPRQ
jgi:hypothetical protein